MFKDIDIKFVDKEITPFGGLSLFFKMLERCNFGQVLQECGLPEQGSNRGYKPWQLVLGLFAGVWREFGITLLITLSEKEKVITRKFVSL